MRRESVEEMIPSLITGTPEERIAKWTAYLDAGICIIGSDADKDKDKDEWIEVRKLTDEDFNRIGFVGLPTESAGWLSYIKTNVDRMASEMYGIMYKDVYAYHHHETNKIIIAADISSGAEKVKYFEGTIKTNCELFVLLKQLNIIEL